MMLIVLIFGISASFAADAEDSIQATDDEVDDAVSAGEVETVSARDTQEKTTSQENETIISASDTPEDTLGATGTFTQLQTLIDNNYGKTLTLTQDYAYDTAFDKTTGMTITGAITIDGQGRYAVDGASTSRIFHVTGANVILKNLILKNGKSASGGGGAVYWTGTSGALTNCNINSNFDGANSRGGAVSWTGTYGTISYCNFNDNKAYLTSNDGGAIYMTGTGGNISDCNFYNNIARDLGSAICITGPQITIKNSYFEGNVIQATDTDLDGGTIAFESGHYGVVQNCTLINNMATHGTGGIGFRTGTYGNVTGCTFINNTGSHGGAVGSLAVSNNLTISDCKFINNTATNSGGAIFYSSAGLTLSNSEFENNKAAANGGAIYESGNDGKITNCGFIGNTVNGQANDIYATDSAKASMVETGTTFGPIYISPNGKGNGRSQSSPANWTYAYENIADGASIIFTAGTYSEFSDFNIQKSISLIGLNGAIITNEDAKRAITISAKDVTVSGLTFKNNSANQVGPAIYWVGTNGKLIDSTFIGNSYTGGDRGGAVRWGGSYGNIINCKFYNNTATSGDGDAGALAIYGSYAVVDDCYFYGNKANDLGSAICVNGHYATIKNTYFENNEVLSPASPSTDHDGGTLSFQPGQYGLVSNCTFINNKARCGAGAIAFHINAPANATIEKCKFINNTGSYGGAINSFIYNTASGVTISDCNFTNNVATISGGAIYYNANSLNVTNCDFTNNKATNSGGAMYLTGNNDTITDSTFSGNIAPTNNDISSTKNVEVSKLTFNTDLSIKVNDIIVGESLTITGTLSAAKAGAIIDIRDKGTKIGTVTVNNNQFTHTFANPSVGTHTISLATSDDSGNTYVYNVNSFSFRAVPVDSYSALQILINRASASSTLTLARNYNYNSAYDTALVGGVKVNKTLIIKGAEFTVDGKNSARAFDVSANGVTIENMKLNNGKSTSNGGAVQWTGSTGILRSITFNNNQATNYKHVYTTKNDLKIYSSTLSGTTASITANPTSTMYGNNIQLTVNFNDGTNVAKTLNILSGSSTVTGVTVPASGTVTTTWTKPAAGNYTLTLATTDSNANTYTFTQPNTKVEIKQYTTDFTISVAGSKVQENVKITVDTGKTDATGYVDILFNSKTTRVTLTNGKGELDVGKLAADTYSVTATYSGDAKYQRTEKGTSFTITKYATTTTLTLTNVNVGNAVPVVATVTSSAPFAVNGKIILVGAQGNKTITINNGQGNLDVSDLPAGRYVVTVEKQKIKEEY